MVKLLKLVMPKMLTAIANHKRPFIFAIEISGDLTPLVELTEI